MLIRLGLTAGTAVFVLLTSCAVNQLPPTEPPVGAAAPGKMYPSLRGPTVLRRTHDGTDAKINGEGPITYESEEPVLLTLDSLPASRAASHDPSRYVRGGERIESQFSDQQVTEARAAAMRQPTSAAIQNFGVSKPTLLSKFDAIDASDCCTGTGFSATVPPDPDMAAGPNHLVVVVNVTFEVYDKSGNSLSGPVPFATFFQAVRGCTAFADGFAAVFDPDVVYDEAEDRFVIGIDGGGDSYCVAATRTGDPTGNWNGYGFATDVNGAFFDFPHMGVGADAIYMGSNQFGGSLPSGFQGRVFAMDKFDMYAGRRLTVVTRELAAPGMTGEDNQRLDGTPQPMHLQGLPFPGPGSKHYIMSEFFDGKTHSVYSWRDPFGANNFRLEGDADLAAASGVPCEDFSCFPVSWPQKRSDEILEGNDYRGHETKFRNGTLWTAQTISCNPGRATRNCIRFAQIDPTQVVPGTLNNDGSLTSSTNGVIQAAVFGDRRAFRQFPSLNANTCNDMVIGYSFGSENLFPSIGVTGRKASDPLGKIGGERVLLTGTTPYSSFQDNGGESPERWGDYTGMAIDPDGTTFWYVGEYARPNTDNPFANWGTFVGSFKIQGCN